MPGASVVEVTSGKQLWATIEAGQKNRHVSATQVPKQRNIDTLGWRS